MNYKDIALIDSNYTLMLYCLLYPSKVDNTLFIVSDGVSLLVRGKLKNCIYLKDKKHITFKNIRELIRNIKIMLSPFYINIRNQNKVHFYGQDHAWFSLIGRNKPFTLLEDGLDNYIKSPSIGYKRNILSLFGFPYQEMGRSQNISKIMLSGILDIPIDIESKVSVFNIHHQWNKLKNEDKENLTKLFMTKKQVKDFYSLEINDGILILTQPLNQDGIISEEEKINNYKQAVSKFEDVNIFYKRHPRDTTNYHQLGWIELKFSDTPVELLILLGLNFNQVITYNSTAIFRFQENKRVIIKPINLPKI